MASSGFDGDKYRSYLSEEEKKNTQWRNGPPNYDVINKFFEEGRTKVWPIGSLEEKVQRLVKTWEMEIVHKVNPAEFKTLDGKEFRISVNGKKPLSLQDVARIGGSYNMFLQTSLPQHLRLYDPSEETRESSMDAFLTTFPRGFAIEVLEVYSGPPVIAYKFRHWGVMEGPFKGHNPTGETIEFFGMGVFKLNEESKIVKVELFYERGELLSGLVKGKALEESTSEKPSSCPFFTA